MSLYRYRYEYYTSNRSALQDNDLGLSPLGLYSNSNKLNLLLETISGIKVRLLLVVTNRNKVKDTLLLSFLKSRETR